MRTNERQNGINNKKKARILTQREVLISFNQYNFEGHIPLWAIATQLGQLKQHANAKQHRQSRTMEQHFFSNYESKTKTRQI